MGRKYAPGGRSLWWQVAISSTGDGMFLTAFPLLAASLTRDPSAIAIVTVATRAPWIFFALLFGALADRVNRRLMMVTADVVRGFVVAVLAALVITDQASMGLIYLCAFLLGTGEVLHATAAQALIPTIIGMEDLVAFNGSATALQAATETFIGPPIGSALFAVSPSVPFVADAISFGGSVFLAANLPDKHEAPGTPTRIRDDVREGWKYLFASPLLKRMAIGIGFLNICYFASEAVLVLYTFEKLHAGKATFTALFVAGAVGLIAGQRSINWVQARTDAAGAITASMWFWAASLIGLSVTSSPFVAMGSWFLLGFGDAFWRVLTVSLRQRVTPNTLLGRVNAVHRLFGMGGMAIGAALGGVVADAIDLRAPFIIAAVAFSVFAFSSRWYWSPARGL